MDGVLVAALLSQPLGSTSENYLGLAGIISYYYM